MSSAADRGWGPGWPNAQTDKIVTVVCGANQLRLPVRAEIGPLVAALVRDLERARGAPFRPDWSWGFANRAIRGTSTPSNHSWGLAIDLDAPDNAMQGPPPPGRNTMPRSTGKIAARYGFRWGGAYTSRPDPMHFEYMGSPADAEGLAPDLDGQENEEMLRKGDDGSDVKTLQRNLNAFHRGDPKLKADGNFGDLTESSTAAAKRKLGLGSGGRTASVEFQLRLVQVLGQRHVREVARRLRSRDVSEEEIDRAVDEALGELRIE
ncbi:MAG: M15 family metallopeptidase [Actinomycetota bacterium]|nr:M15 family metallopeptidase [Actinomycetota bacterium]